MIRKILNYFGFIHKSELTEAFLCLEIGKIIGNPSEYSIEPKQDEFLFRDLARIDGINEWLTATMARDMQRDFAGQKEQSALVHGAFARTAYIKGKILASNKALQKKNSMV